LVEVRKILTDVSGISFVEFEKADVIRHRLVADIIDAYEREALRGTMDDRTRGPVTDNEPESGRR
ncbi:MAG: PhoH family protein, partial [Candidatus Kapaibacterium sp.]